MPLEFLETEQVEHIQERESIISDNLLHAFIKNIILSGESFPSIDSLVCRVQCKLQEDNIYIKNEDILEECQECINELYPPKSLADNIA